MEWAGWCSVNDNARDALRVRPPNVASWWPVARATHGRMRRSAVGRRCDERTGSLAPTRAREKVSVLYRVRHEVVMLDCDSNACLSLQYHSR